MTENRYATALQSLGFEVSEKVDYRGSTEVRTARLKATKEWRTDRDIVVDFGNNGTACIQKPNGTHKWVYGKSPAQLHRIVQQVIEFQIA